MNILVTGVFQLNSGEREQLEAAGHKVFVHGDERAPVDCPERYEAVVCNGLFLYNSIERFASLRVIQLTSAGLDRLPSAAFCSYISRAAFLRRIRCSTNGKSIAACWSFPASACASSAAEMWGARSQSG